jgi:hypothetical protein
MKRDLSGSSPTHSWRAVRALALAAALVAGCTAGVLAQEPAKAEAQPGGGQAQGADLAKKLSNPISDLVSVPFQFNWEQGVGPSKETRFILNVQPVMPFSLNKDWNMIVRVIAPLISQPALTEGGTAASGVGDIFTSFFFSPLKVKQFTVGFGPAVSMPSNAEPTLGSGKFSAGPTIVVLKQTGRWTYGALWNQVWSFAGNADRTDVNQMFLQPFLAYQATRTVTLSAQSETTANWEAAEKKFTVPINFSVSKLSSFGVFPASYQLGFGVFAAHPDIGPSWKIRGAIVIMLPRSR